MKNTKKSILFVTVVLAAWLVAGIVNARENWANWRIDGCNAGSSNTNCEVTSGKEVAVQFLGDKDCSVKFESDPELLPEESSIACVPVSNEPHVDGWTRGKSWKAKTSGPVTFKVGSDYSQTFTVTVVDPAVTKPEFDTRKEEVDGRLEKLERRSGPLGGNVDLRLDFLAMPNDDDFQRPGYGVQIPLMVRLWASDNDVWGFKLGAAYQFARTNIFVNPSVNPTDNETPLEMHTILARPALAIAPLSWLEFDLGLDLGARSYHNEAQLVLQDPNGRVLMDNNNTQWAFLMGPYADVQFLPHRNLIIALWGGFHYNPTEVNYSVADSSSAGERGIKWNGGLGLGGRM